MQDLLRGIAIRDHAGNLFNASLLGDALGVPVVGPVTVTVAYIDPVITDFSTLPAPFQGKTMGQDDEAAPGVLRALSDNGRRRPRCA